MKEGGKKSCLNKSVKILMLTKSDFFHGDAGENGKKNMQSCDIDPIRPTISDPVKNFFGYFF